MRFYNKNEFEKFQEEFQKNLVLLVKRITKFDSIEKYSEDYYVYFDMILVQIRAMFIENPRYKNNYTGQVYLRKLGMDKEVDIINSFLEEKIYADLTIKEAIRTIVDKFIVHYDPLNDKDIEIEKKCRSILTKGDHELYIGNLVLMMALSTADAELRAYINGNIDSLKNNE